MDEREQEVRERSREVEETTLPKLKQEVNMSFELMADKLLQLEAEIEVLKQGTRHGVLSEQELLKCVGFILSNEKLAAFLADKIKEQVNSERPIYNINIGG